MRRLIVGHLRTRPGRALTLMVGILVATASFAVLTGAARTGRLEVRGRVARDFRSSYDILVRPRGARTAVERRQGLVRPGALSGIAGGITRRQWQAVRRQPGVEIAAPIASIGYTLVDVELPVDLTGRLRGQGDALVRLDVERITDRGLTRQRDAALFAYVTRRRLLPEPQARNAVAAPRIDVPDGALRPICVSGYDELTPAGPFDPSGRAGQRGDLDCASTRTGRFGAGFGPFARGRVGAVVRARVPAVIAAVDPSEEARLTGLDRAVIAGRPLRARDRPTATFVPRVPVLAASRPAADEATTVTVRAMPAAAATAVRSARTPAATRRALRRLPTGPTRHIRFSAADEHRLLLQALDRNGDRAPAVTNYWAVGPTSYAQAGDALVPRTVRNPSSVWSSRAEQTGYIAPPLSAEDRQYRRLTPSVGAASAQIGQVFPALHAVGRFDPRRLAVTGDPRVDAALGTTATDGLAGADAASRRALGGRRLLPNGNLGGYQTSVPVLITNLGSLPAFAAPNFTPARGAAPISAIRVRVGGVRGIDAASRERVRQTAAAIRRATGLDVDLTIGSSSAPQTIALPAGTAGRPALRLTENWVRKGVGLTILRAIDRKSVALFVLILCVCSLFVANASAATVARRRRELAVLACTGWSPSRLFGVVLGEVTAIGAVGGLLGGALALAVSDVAGVSGAPARAALAVPAGIVLSALAAAVPASRAARAHPADLLTPAVTATRSQHSPTSLTGLAAVNLLRTPGRNGLALVSLAVGTAALTLLLIVTLSFRGAVVGSVLGDAVAVEVRGVDVVAAAVTVALGAAAVADVLYLSLRERAAELAVLRTTGWRERHVVQLVATEGALLGLAGAGLGALLGLGLSWTFAGAPSGATAGAAALSAGGAFLVALAACVIPARRAGRRAIAAELVDE